MASEPSPSSNSLYIIHLPNCRNLHLPTISSDEPRKEPNDGPLDQEDIDRRWLDIFGEKGIQSASDLSTAYGRFRAAPPPRFHEDFFKELVARVPTDHVAALIQAFGDCAEFEEYDLRKFLEQIPITWRERLAVRAALRDLVKKSCTRFCFNITLPCCCFRISTFSFSSNHNQPR